MSQNFPPNNEHRDSHAEADRLQSRLHEHYLSLSNARSGIGLPVFALEHGLSDVEFALLHNTAMKLVGQRSTFRKTPLLLIVVAAEIGYRYDGGEIWSIFSDEMPGWADNSDSRQRVRSYFAGFAKEYRGAVPTGAWARKFSIISWPVVHSILPRVFQRQLVEILYNYRYRLTSDVIDDSERLGRFIDGASSNMSDRFRNLAQNHVLIGQVATALLTADDADLAGDETLLQSTVRRIVDDLSSERIARNWLRDAQAATRTNFRGLRSTPDRRRRDSQVERSVDVVDPQLRLLRTTDCGWRLILELQDLSPLTQRHPEMIDDLSQRRCRVNGGKKLLAPSALLWPGQRLELTEPLIQGPVLHLVGGSDRSNGFLADYCRLPMLPWLFRVEDGEGSLVAGHFVRPNSNYMLVSADDLTSRSPIVIPESSPLDGLHLLRIDLPQSVDETGIEILEAIGINVQTTIRVWPAGLANAGWNGVDVAVWLEGDPIIIGVESDRIVTEMIVTVGDEATRLSVDSQPIFLEFDGLGVGQHTMSLGAFSPDGTSVASTSVRILVRPRSIRPESGSLREGLVLLTSPATPTLSELIGGDVNIEVLGPRNEPLTARIALHARGKEIPLGEYEVQAKLPLDGGSSRQLVSRMMRSDQIGRRLEKCDIAKVSFRHQDLGIVETSIERQFTPLRWIVSSDSETPKAVLIDNMDGTEPHIEFRPMSEPDQPERLRYYEGESIMLRSTGLLTAKANDFSISTIVSPGRIRHFADLGAQRTEISLQRRTPSASSLRYLVDLADLWHTAERPNFNAGMVTKRIQQAIAVEIAAGIGGKYWARVEHERFKNDMGNHERMLDALGTARQQKSLITTMLRRIPAPESMSTSNLVATFSTIVAWADSSTLNSDMSLGEFCLRVASQPSSVAGLPDDDFEGHAIRMIEHPITLRLARFIALAVDQAHGANFESEAPYEGFAWT